MRTPKWLLFIYCAILLGGIYVALPNILSQEQRDNMPWLVTEPVTLGLDLQGGSELLLELDSNALKEERITTLLDGVRGQLRNNQIPPQTPPRRIGDNIVVTFADSATAERAATAFANLINQIPGGPLGAPIDDIAINQTDMEVRLSVTPDAITSRISDAVNESLEIIRRRVDEVGVSEPSIQREGTDRIRVQLPGLQDPQQLRTLLGQTAKMTFHLVRTDIDPNSPIPPDVMQAESEDGFMPYYFVERSIALDGAHLTGANGGRDQNGRPVVNIRFDTTGARIFANITTNHVNRQFAIMLDDKIISAPNINEPITGGSASISGSFTPESAGTLAAILRAGSLPAPLTVIQENTVGPDLGEDAIRMGVMTGLIGFALVAIFIIFLYGTWGLIADVALALHTVLTFAALTLIQATLTLPGIAGIILGIGIAVDANILINERIREETKKGLGAMAALEQGFKRAFATIVDANVTSIIATLLLFQFGSGPIRGFAVTMLLGIVISMFTDITLVRVMMAGVIRRFKMKVLHIKPMFNLIPAETNFRFMRARFLGLAVSFVLSVASVILFFQPGLNYGLDFLGGSRIVITTSQPADLAQLREAVMQANVGEISLQNVDTVNDVTIRIQQQDDEDNQAQNIAVDKVKAQIQTLYPDVVFSSTESIGPKVSGELKRAGLLAVVLAAIAMSIYIWFRFEWFFAVGAMITLVLDTTKMVGFFALFQIDFNLTAIAGLLTLVGYSINDKVVVYDRIRENLRLYKKMSLRDVIDMSLNQVLVRCIFTSLTTILALLPMAIWGGSAVFNFAVPMVVGVVVATSSSIFISAPVLLFLGQWWQKHLIGREDSSKEKAHA